MRIQASTIKQITPVLFSVLLAFINPFGWSPEVVNLISILVLMLAWWLLESVPMAVTALLPVILFPLVGISSMEVACAPYGDKYIFLFLGGFLLALALEKSNLHKRFSLSIVMITGTNAKRIILGFMLSSWFISMWISNTATTLMMFPIALAVSSLFDDVKAEHSRSIRNFRINLFLGIAYSSSIGGMATIIGTPPNAAAVGILSETFHREISFVDWMMYGFPFSLAFLFGAYFLLTTFIFPMKLGRFDKGQILIKKQLADLGEWSKSEKNMLLVFAIAIFLWLSEGIVKSYFPKSPLSDVWIGMAAGLSLFIIQGNEQKPLLVWEDTSRLPWGILLMFGGGLSLAMAFKKSGALDMLTQWLSTLNYLQADVYLIALCAIGLFLTAIMSNLAMVTLFIPVVASLAQIQGIDPLVFAIPVTISASCDFMFPMSTPPNAIAFSSGHVKAVEMLKAGFVLNLYAFLLLILLVLVF
jgi:sodium-dependent dicarboxylate transporter 2/3/5